MMNKLDVQTFDSKLRRSKNEIDNNNERAMQLISIKTQLLKKYHMLENLNKALKEKIQKDDYKLIKNLEINKTQSIKLMEDEKELGDLRNERINLINQNHITDSDLIKNKLFYDEIINQKKILSKNLKEYIEYQNEIKKAMTNEIEQIDDKIFTYNSKNNCLHNELGQVFGHIKSQTSNLFSCKDRNKSQC